jgi:hypothetical protein
MADCYFPADITYAVLFREEVSINYSYLMKNFWAVFKKMTILCSGAPVKGPCFLCYTVHINQALTYDRKILKHQIL